MVSPGRRKNERSVVETERTTTSKFVASSGLVDSATWSGERLARQGLGEWNLGLGIEAALLARLAVEVPLARRGQGEGNLGLFRRRPTKRVRDDGWGRRRQQRAQQQQQPQPRS